MQTEPHNFKERYYPRRAAKVAALNQADFIGALMRALARFPDARKSVIEEFDRLGQQIG